MCKPIPKPAGLYPNASYKEVYSATACFFETRENVINPGLCQADIPHLLHFALKDKEANYSISRKEDGSRLVIPKASPTDTFPLELDVCSEGADQSTYETTEPSLAFMQLCPDPYFFSTGPHRALVGITYEGERYAIAFEEAEGTFKENLFIAVYTEEGRRRIEGSYEYVVDIVEAAVRSVAGVDLFRPVHDFNICLYDSPFDILAEGCTPSPKIFDL